MPDIPQDIYRSAEKAIRAEMHSSREIDCEALAKAALDAAAPLLAARIAGKIGAHGPSGTPGIDNAHQVRLRRHLDIAARIAAGAFTTEAESKQQTAEALARGDFIACDLPEEPRA